MVKYLFCDSQDDYHKLFDKIGSLYDGVKLLAYNKDKRYLVIDTDNRGLKKFSHFKEIAKSADEKEYCLVNLK